MEIHKTKLRKNCSAGYTSPYYFFHEVCFKTHIKPLLDAMKEVKWFNRAVEQAYRKKQEEQQNRIKQIKKYLKKGYYTGDKWEKRMKALDNMYFYTCYGIKHDKDLFKKLFPNTKPINISVLFNGWKQEYWDLSKATFTPLLRHEEFTLLMELASQSLLLKDGRYGYIEDWNELIESYSLDYNKLDEEGNEIK
jgi:hypothetical protein